LFALAASDAKLDRMHCRQFHVPLSRREMLRHCAGGFGAVALAGLLHETAYAENRHSAGGVLHSLHHEPKARRVIFLYMDGGPSQVDTFDPKPRLDRENGLDIRMKVPATQFNNVGKVLASPWKFRQHGESGVPVSELFPHIAGCVDELCVIRSMVADFSEHTNANYFLHTCHGQQGRPSAGSWVTYGLGSECRDLPGFMVLNGGLIPPGGLDNFNSGFLPATFQGSIIKPGKAPLADLERLEPNDSLQRSKLNLVRRLDQKVLERIGEHDALEAAISNYELAFRMQTAVPDVLDLGHESAATKRLYGLEADYAPTRTFANLCLLARRLAERGVRFIELTCPSLGHDRWDQHSGLKKGHEDNARAVDQPIAALLIDLKARGLLQDTLVLWGGEFGRTPVAQGTDGRDHNPYGFTVWLAGGGVRGGTIYGATDDYGYFAVENKVQMYDLHATLLHLLGIDHRRLTYRFGGRDMRLTDVHGEVLHEIIA
jgi:hypothetical protein